MFLLAYIAFLVGALTRTFLTLFIFKQRPIVNLDSPKFENGNNCIIPKSGRLIFSLQGKNYEIDTKQIKAKICSK
jgi:hypothetical protein